MDRDLHPAGTHDELLAGSLADDSTTTRDGEALPGEDTTPPRPPLPGEALPNREVTHPQPATNDEALAEVEIAPEEERHMEMLPDDGEAPVATARNRALRTTTRDRAGDSMRLQVNNMGYEILYPSQTRFKCPGCGVTYNTHASLIRHVGVSHKQLKLTVSFKCAMCDYAHADLRSTAGHYRHNHGAAVPPQPVTGSNEKACPFCPSRFPSTRSCSMHIREKHMDAMCQQRAREAAEKGVQPGEPTARTKWTHQETERFKAALARDGPANNQKLAEAVGTRTKEQVSAFKCRFLKANPTWIEEHCQRTTPPHRASRAASTGSPSWQPSQHRTPPGPSNTRGQAADTRATAAPPTRRRSGVLLSSPSASPPEAAADEQQLPSRREPSHTSPQAAVSERQHCSPGGGVAITPLTPSTLAGQEESTPSPPPAPVSTGTAQRLQRADQALSLLRSRAVTRWEPEAPGPDGRGMIQPAALLPHTSTLPPHMSTHAHAHTPPHMSTHTYAHTPPTDDQSSPEEETPLPPTTLTQEGEAPRPQLVEEALAILNMDNVQLWDPKEEILSPSLAGIATPPSFSPPPPATVTERQYCSPGVGVASEHPPPTTTPAPPTPASTSPLGRVTERQYCCPEGEVKQRPLLQTTPTTATPVPPPPAFRSPLGTQSFIPGRPWTSMRTQRMDQVQQPPGRWAASDTSPPSTPPSSPQCVPPLAAVSGRQHCSPGVDEAAIQPPLSSPAMAESTHLTPPSSPGPPLPPPRVPGSLARISIDPDRMDETLRHPFHQELTPFTGRQLGNFEWVAFEEALLRWITAIKEVVTAQRRRPPNPTSQWAQRRRRREHEAQGVRSPPPAEQLPADPAEETGYQTATTNNRAPGRARRAAKARFLQKLYRANPGTCMRQLLENTPRIYCNIAEPELVAHYTNTFAAPPPLDPPPAWLFPERRPGGARMPGTTDEGDVLQSPVTPEEVVTQFKRTKRTAPGADGITYANWRWVDPLGLILSTIFNICRINSRVPRSWKHSTVTLIHKGGDVTSVSNWRPISLQLTIYKLYSAIIARRIASWATTTSAFSEAQKGFLAFDGCAEHNFLLRSIMTDSRRRKKDLLLTWLDLRDAFGSVSHHLILLLMHRLGLSGSVLEIVRDI